MIGTVTKGRYKTSKAADSHGFSARLLRWYRREKRALPWRETRDPYRIWVSEIMLQQTRVAAVLGHYGEFIARFPDVRRLAEAREQDVLAVWSGLGYYRRARAMHRAARRVMAGGGELPSTEEGWRAMPGVGRYTAAAVASIAYGRPTAVVDGNVERVLCRARGVEGEGAWEAAQELLARDTPGDFNSAMMELGALVCLPKAPRCGVCPIHALCETRGEGEVTRANPQRKRKVAYRLHVRSSAVLLVQRAAHERLMPEMWELPRCERAEPKAVVLRRLRHSITNTDYTVKILAGDGEKPVGGRWVKSADLERLPLTGLTRKVLRAEGLLPAKSLAAHA